MTTIDSVEMSPSQDAAIPTVDLPSADRQSDAVARKTIERLLPDPDGRARTLDRLVASIRLAQEVGPNRWGVTLYTDRLRLNVGMFTILELAKESIWLALDPKALAPDDMPRLRQLDEWRDQHYDSLPELAGGYIACQELTELLPLVAAAHEQSIRVAASRSKVFKAQLRDAHSEGVLAYLRATMAPDLSSPDYRQRVSLPDVDREVIEQALHRFDTEVRLLPKWSNWEAKESFRYALEWEGQRYPVKEIARMATGVTQQFQPEHAREYLTNRGFQVVPLRDQRSVGQNGIGMGIGNVRDILHEQVMARGFQFTPEQIATYYTALQAKGFVILSGISGTGKTKLAQHFAELLPQPMTATITDESEDESITISLKRYMFKYNRLIIPKQATRLFDPPAPGQTKEVTLTFGDQTQKCRLTHAVYGDTEYVALMLRGAARTWFKQTFTIDDTLRLEPEFDDNQELIAFRLSDGTAPAPTSGREHNPRSDEVTVAANETGTNWLFIPVRPDWRDGKSLLGYFNPLTSAYVWTDFLRFLVRASQSYRARDGLAWFVILDEMNLARVEYYFADLLSVLESGRTPEGWTREPLRLDYPADASGNPPPRELPLPPNLYFIGTVNVDETTHAFSPKVLDRAFTIEFVEADFATYPPTPTAAAALTDREQWAVLRRFTGDGSFQHIEKDRVVTYIDAHPEVRDHLQTLNTELRHFHMHFGFRVFDEIVSFLAAADENGLFDDLGAATVTFDYAVLMKVLPKFHGSRGKLEAPLRAVLAWCINPTAPDVAAIAATLDQCDSAASLVQVLNRQSYQYKHTAARVGRMLWALYTDGFASFG